MGEIGNHFFSTVVEITFRFFFFLDSYEIADSIFYIFLIKDLIKDQSTTLA